MNRETDCGYEGRNMKQEITCEGEQWLHAQTCEKCIAMREARYEHQLMMLLGPFYLIWQAMRATWVKRRSA